jgi:magnesium transporter
MIDDTIHDIEHRIFEGKESEMVSSISSLNRTLVDFKQAVRFHGETLASLERTGTEFFGASFAYYLSVITGEYRKIQKTIDDHKEILRDLRETNDSLLTAKTNDIITKLTILNFIMLPLGLITWIFGMSMNTPLIQSANDFYLVLGAMVVTGLVMFIYFRTKKWL